jgi:hypothetical protein
MKLADSDSKISRKIEELASIKENYRISKRLEKWLTDDERIGNFSFVFIEEKMSIPHKILMLTGKRLVLLHCNFFWKIHEESDKLWSQFVSVHFKEGMFYSSLHLSFVQQDNDNEKSLWSFRKLDKKNAQKFYTILKTKELSVKEASFQKSE